MSPEMIYNLLSKAMMQTLQMVLVAGVIGSIIGLPIGVFPRHLGQGRAVSGAEDQPRARADRQCRALDAVHHPCGRHRAADAASHRHLDRHGGGDRAADHRHHSVLRAAGRIRDPRDRQGVDRGGPRHGRDAVTDRLQGAARRSAPAS
jgi:hypothetical protein